MEKNKILDYEQVENILNKIATSENVQEIDDLGKTEHGLKIRHYTIGNGKQNIVITGATHGSEIITTDFIIRLMKKMCNNENEWKNIFKDFKIHFIPVLNPEGYLITTSAIRKIIPREMSEEEAEKICKKYYMEYREDDIKELENKLKRHQEMFKGVDYTCIPEKYKDIRESVKKIFDKYEDLPKWCLHTWSANANGIDIQANSEYNPRNDEILADKEIYMNSLRYNNINIAHPGPINCPFDKEKGFKSENETIAISNLLDSLNKDGKLFAYLNYHSTGGVIFQRPAIIPDNLKIEEGEMQKKEIVNYMFAKLYSDKTYKDYGINLEGKNKKEISKYIVKTQNSSATSSNDIFRIKYPKDLLIELSGMGGNPIGPYGDIKGNYTNAIKSNLDAVKYTLDIACIAQMIAEISYKRISKLKENKEYNKVIELEDMIYKEFSEKVRKLENTQKGNQKKEDEIEYDR